MTIRRTGHRPGLRALCEELLLDVVSPRLPPKTGCALLVFERAADGSIVLEYTSSASAALTHSLFAAMARSTDRQRH